MIATYIVSAPSGSSISVINQGRQYYPTIPARAKYLSIQLTSPSPQELNITNNPTPGTTGFPGRKLTATSPLFELSDFAGGNVPLDFWLTGGADAYITIIFDA